MRRFPKINLQIKLKPYILSEARILKLEKKTSKFIITTIGLFTIVKLFLYLKLGSFQFGLSSYWDLHALADWKQIISSSPYVFEDTTILNGKAFLITGHLNTLISHYLGLSSYDAWTLYLFWVCNLIFIFLKRSQPSFSQALIGTLSIIISVPFLDFVYSEFSPSDQSVILSTALFLTGLYLQKSYPRLQIFLWALSIWNRLDFSFLIFASLIWREKQLLQFPIKRLGFLSIVIFLSLAFRYYIFDSASIIGDGNMRIHSFQSNIIETTDNEQSFGNLILNLRDNIVNTWFSSYNPRNEDQEFKFYFYFIIPFLFLIRKHHLIFLIPVIGAYLIHALFFSTNPIRYQFPFWILFLIIISNDQKNSIRTFNLTLISTLCYALLIRPFWVGPYEFYSGAINSDQQEKSILLNNKFSFPTPYEFNCHENLNFFGRFLNDCKIKKSAQLVYHFPKAQKCYLDLSETQCSDIKIYMQDGQFSPQAELPMNKGLNIINLINNSSPCLIEALRLNCKEGQQ